MYSNDSSKVGPPIRAEHRRETPGFEVVDTFFWKRQTQLLGRFRWHIWCQTETTIRISTTSFTSPSWAKLNPGGTLSRVGPKLSLHVNADPERPPSPPRKQGCVARLNQRERRFQFSLSPVSPFVLSDTCSLSCLRSRVNFLAVEADISLILHLHNKSFWRTRSQRIFKPNLAPKSLQDWCQRYWSFFSPGRRTLLIYIYTSMNQTESDREREKCMAKDNKIRQKS